MITWKQGLQQMKQIEIQRCMLPKNSAVKSVELHGFGDASSRAYGSAVYLCAEDTEGRRTSHPVMGKAGVAPSKRVTLPRLELLAAYITARFLKYVAEALPGMVNDIFAWSDSKVALHWIRKPSYHWKTFVANRVGSIHERVDPNIMELLP